MTKLYRITTYLGDEEIGQPLYLTDSENDKRWLAHFTENVAPTRRIVDTFQLVSSVTFGDGLGL